VQKKRRCREPRWDFTAEDDNIFPIRIQEGGGLYGFCPAKVTWDREVGDLYETMLVCVEMQTLLISGGVADQPSWFIELLAWFAPEYNLQKFISRAKMVLGDSDNVSKTSAQTAPRPRKR